MTVVRHPDKTVLVCVVCLCECSQYETQPAQEAFRQVHDGCTMMFPHVEQLTFIDWFETIKECSPQAKFLAEQLQEQWQ